MCLELRRTGPNQTQGNYCIFILTMPFRYCSLEAQHSPANNLSVRPTHLSLTQQSGNGALFLSLLVHPVFHPQACSSSCFPLSPGFCLWLQVACEPSALSQPEEATQEEVVSLGRIGRSQTNWTGQCQCRYRRRHSSLNAPKYLSLQTSPPPLLLKDKQKHRPVGDLEIMQ